MTQAAEVYGEALYSLARDEQLSRELLQQLSLLDEVCAQQPEFLRLLSSANLTKQERCQIVEDSFRGNFHPYVLNFLKILVEKGYIHQFSQCCRVFRRLYNEENGILPVRAGTAVPLTQQQKDKLTAKLCEVTGKTVDLICQVDASCLGGVRLDFDGQRLDGTVRHRLDDLRAILKNTVL